MKKLLLANLLIAVCVLPAISQATEELEHYDQLENEKYVLVLKDGEQLVIRGGYEVRGNRTYFYLEHGSTPVYAMLATDSVDFKATEAANNKLRRERIRRENYYKLVEEMRRKSLEGEYAGPFIVESEAGDMQVDPEFQDDLRENTFYVQEARTYPPYDEGELEFKPETWWRAESRRLFTDLEEHNARMEQLSNDHNAIARRIQQAQSREQEQQLRAQIQQFRDALQTERNLGRLIGNRLVELSEIAQKLGIPMDWVIPDESPIYTDETP